MAHYLEELKRLKADDRRRLIERLCYEARQAGLEIYGLVVATENEAELERYRAKADGVVRFNTASGVCEVRAWEVSE
jgi:hypothetical protein